MSYPIGRSHWQARVLLGFWVVAACTLLAWTSSSQHLGWRHLLALAAVMVVGSAAWRGWKNSPVGQLTWDGQVWRWEGPGYQVGVAEYALLSAADFQNTMLLCIENQAHAKLWLWAERRAFAVRWLDLRRAVYSPHRLPNTSGKPP